MDKDHRASILLKLRKAKFAFRVSFYPLLFLYVIFALPLIGNFAYIAAHEVIGSHCPPSSGSMPADCFRNGINIGELQYNYSMTLLAMGIMNPFLAFMAIAAIVPLWLLLPWVTTVVVSFCMKASYENALAQPHA